MCEGPDIDLESTGVQASELEEYGSNSLPVENPVLLRKMVNLSIS